MDTLVCPWCGAEFAPHHKLQRYCCGHHRQAAATMAMRRRRGQARGGPGNIVPRPCRECGNVFQPSRADNMTCSPECASGRWYRQHLKSACEACGFVPVHVIQLDVHHLDGNHYNNELPNLQTLCANCHRLENLP